MFEKFQAAPPDPILGLTEAFISDPCKDKVNLGAGVYKDEQGRTPVLESVKAAEAALVVAETTKNYLPIAGEPEYGKCVQELIFGGWPILAENRVRTAHTPGGTGALRLGAELLAQAKKGSTVWVSAPTWANHASVFAAAGFVARDYPYYDPATRGVRTTACLDALRQVPAGDVVLLHVGCHNPTGADPDPAFWKDVAAIAARQGWTPFIDAAYLGFGDGLDQDRQPLAAFASAGVEALVAVSFSKNMALYRERVGALTVVAPSAAMADIVFSQLKRCARVLYSNPPSHGGLVARRVMEDALLRDLWHRDVVAMRTRICKARAELAGGLAARRPDVDASFITRQRGMFSFTGLTPAQVDFLRAKKSIYMTRDGRINVAAVTPGNVNYVCDAFVEAWTQVV